MEAAFGITVEEEALFLAIGFVEDDETAAGAGGFGLGQAAGHLYGFGEA